MKKVIPLLLFLIVSLILLASGTKAREKSADNSDTQELSKELRVLKKEVMDLKKEIKGLKKLLISRLPAKHSPKLTIGKTSIKDDPFIGKADAPMVLVEFSEYQCPYCGRHLRNTFPQIKKSYIDTGKLKYVFKDMPLAFHKDAQKAAEAAHCAGEEGKYWEMHDIMFKNQKGLNKANLISFGKNMGLDVKQFEKCLNDDKYAEGIKEDIKAARTNGISGTPSFILGKLNGKGEVEGEILRGAVPYENFETTINARLKK